MRNIFDQYSSPENRLTHALACCLDRDEKLLRAFLKWVGVSRIPKGALRVLEQRIPGSPVEEFEDEEGRKGLPDLWIHDEAESWCLLVESKVAATLTSGQLRRHVATARRQDYSNPNLLALTVEKPARMLSGEIATRTWSELYEFLHAHRRRSVWAFDLIEYFHVAEARMTNDGYLNTGTLTRFAGIPFDKEHPYSYGEAKRVLKLFMGELRKRKDLAALGMDPKGPGRSAITGRDAQRIWDFIPLRRAAKEGASFTDYPHFTIGLHPDCMEVIVTLPNGARPPARRNLVDLGPEGLRDVVVDVGRRILKVVGHIPRAQPKMYALQRHYTSQRSTPIQDGSLYFDLRTAMSGGAIAGVKPQPEWVDMAYSLLANRRSNIQFALGGYIPYGGPLTDPRSCIDLAAGTWVACRPWLDAILTPAHSRP